MAGLPDIETAYSDTYKRVIVAGMFGGIIPGGLEAIVYSEERRAERVIATHPVSPNRMSIKRIVESQLIIDPLQMRAIHRWLGDQIAHYERIFGPIPTDEEIDRRTKGQGSPQ